LPVGLELAAYPRREDPRDVLLNHAAGDIDSLPHGAKVLTGAQRRRAQLLARRPDLEIESMRGNVDGRIRRWRRGGATALLLARAGLARLGLLSDRSLTPQVVPTEVMLPAPGQGTLAIETRKGSEAAELCRDLNHVATAQSAAAEREIVRAFGGDCTLPLAAWGRWEGDLFRLTGLLATPDGRRMARGEGSDTEPLAAAAACIAAMRQAGAEDILAVLRASVSAGRSE
jgi:hydroxymethylbilane synthase